MDVTESTVARLNQSLDKFNQEANCKYDISFSFGVVRFDPDKHRTIEALLADGDTLMYQTKKSKQQSDAFSDHHAPACTLSRIPRCLDH